MRFSTLHSASQRPLDFTTIQYLQPAEAKGAGLGIRGRIHVQHQHWLLQGGR
jgi:hypothetical protein